MPTDETALEALALSFENRLAWQERYLASAESGAAEAPVVEQARARVVEARLIADALRCKLASLTAPAAQEGQFARSAWIDGACWASMDNDVLTIEDIYEAADEKFAPPAPRGGADA